MEIVRADSAALLHRFIDFPDELYKNDEKYTPYMKADLRKTLKRLVLREKSYRALLAMDGNKPLARVLFTVEKDKQLKTDKCGFFSMYECVDDISVANAILTGMKKELSGMGAEYISGAFSPFDPDNRRGIMVQGFEKAPLIFTSYNMPYYDAQLTQFGLVKQTDTYQYRVPYDEEVFARMRKLSAWTEKRCGVRVDCMDDRRLDRDITDFCKVMAAATTEINYQAAPSEEEIRSILKGWRRFLKPELILIARRNADNEPVGIAMAIPDYFELFRRARGKTDLRGLCILLFGRNRIRSLRSMLQYVVPAYQKKGVIAMLAYALMCAARRGGYTCLEAGTILEDNKASISVMKAINGELARVYRLYSMKI